MPVQHSILSATNSCHVSFRNGSTQHLGPKERALGLLNHLLVDTLGRMVHHNCAGLIIDLGIDSGVADEVDNPFLTFGGGQAETCGKIAKVEVSARSKI